jgi:mono/diheme cytochrome c family protein
VRYNTHQIKDDIVLLQNAAQDEHGRVRLEAVTAASWLSQQDGLSILNMASNKPLDKWTLYAHETAVAHLNNKSREEKKDESLQTTLKGKERELFTKGKEIYGREGFCMTCHQADGSGLPPSGFPPLTGTKWVTGSEERLIKIALNGLYGPIEVNNHKYRGDVPMTPFRGMLNDEEIASILTYVRNSFGNKASAIYPDKVKAIREQTKDKIGFYTPDELLKDHKMEKE